VRLLDHRWATVGADDRVLALDVANLTIDLAAFLGARRAVELGVEAIGADALAGALPYVQPRLLTADVRVVVKGHPELLDEVRTAIREVTGADEVPLAEVRRVTGRSVLSLVVAAFLVYMGLSFAANWSDMVDALRAADWSYLPLLLVFAAAGYPAGAMSLMGAVPPRLPLGETTQVMLAQTFLNRFTPANAGGMALRARYLQRRGVDLAVAATGIGLTSAASGAAQVVLIVVFVLWAGSSTTGLTDFSLPDSSVIALVLVVVLVALGVILLTPWGRRRIWTPALRSLRHVVDDLRELARSPAKMAMLFGGALLGKLATILAFVVSCEMLGADLSFAEYGVLYMTANTVASAAPTPGGLGALEAALLVALTGRGVPSDQAFASVVVFRLATYWLPTLPSWLMLRHVRRAGIV
jgi:undecaprenyl-diphosphatase